MPDRLLLICAVIDVATSEQPRSLKDFVRWPRLPIREMYLTRVVINLVYFARNYLNFVLLFVAASAFIFPLVLLVLGAAIVLHMVKRTNVATAAAAVAEGGDAPTNEAVAKTENRISPQALQVGAKLLQVAACLLVTHQYGFFTLVSVSLFPMLIVAAHAALTPYTDDAMEHYESVMASRGFHAPAPRSPTKSYENVDKMFQGAIVRPGIADEAQGAASTSTLPSAPQLSPRRAAKKLTPQHSTVLPAAPTMDEQQLSATSFTPTKPKRLLNLPEGVSDAPGGLSDDMVRVSAKNSTSARLMPASSSLPVATMRRRDR